MAIQWLDNFQQYGTTIGFLTDGSYAEVAASRPITIVADPDPIAAAAGSKVLQITDALGGVSPYTGSYVRKVVPTVATGGMSFRLWLNGLPAGAGIQPYYAFTDSSNVIQLLIAVSPIGTLKVYRGIVDNSGNATGTGALLGESSTAVVTGAWQHIETKVTIDDATGAVEIRVDGNSVLILTGIDTKNTANASYSNTTWGYKGTSGGDTIRVKDVVCWDNSGSYNTTFIGPAFVYSMRPDSDVSGTWTIFGGAGSAFASINDTSPDDDTKYIYSGWPAATADICTLTDLPVDATSVKGMMAYVRSRKSDGGDGNLQVSLVSGASTGNGADRPITTAYTYWSDVFETDPATGVQWTVAAANACKIKLNRTL